MKLYITDDSSIDATFDSIVMPVYEFNDVRCHPFIVSSGFTVAIVDICESKIKIPYLERLMTFINVIPRINGKLDGNSVSILSALYKDKAASLRINFMTDKEAFNKLIEELSIKYEWSKYL